MSKKQMTRIRVAELKEQLREELIKLYPKNTTRITLTLKSDGFFTQSVEVSQEKLIECGHERKNIRGDWINKL